MFRAPRPVLGAGGTGDRDGPWGSKPSEPTTASARGDRLAEGGVAGFGTTGTTSAAAPPPRVGSRGGLRRQRQTSPSHGCLAPVFKRIVGGVPGCAAMRRSVGASRTPSPRTAHYGADGGRNGIVTNGGGAVGPGRHRRRYMRQNGQAPARPAIAMATRPEAYDLLDRGTNLARPRVVARSTLKSPWMLVREPSAGRRTED